MCAGSFFSWAENNPATVTDQLLADLLYRHAPKELYKQADNPWPGGDYSLQVFKNGKPVVTSSAGDIHLNMPIQVVITGNAANELLKLKLACNTRFNSTAEVTFTPVKAGVMTAFKSSITLPIPAVIANCDGMQLPIDQYLKTLVAQNKAQWEIKLDQKLNAWLVEENL